MWPTEDAAFRLRIGHSVNFLHYATKMLTPKPTPHLTLTLTSEIGAEKIVAFQEISS